MLTELQAGTLPAGAVSVVLQTQCLVSNVVLQHYILKQLNATSTRTFSYCHDVQSEQGTGNVQRNLP